MNKYTVFNSSGIKTIYTITEDMLQLNLEEGDSYVEGSFSDEFYYVNSGAITPLPEKPNYPCDFNKDTLSWIWNSSISWGEVRQERDHLLNLCDWTQVTDNSLTSEQRQAWQTYRQQLRNLPDNTPDPRTPTWPTRPT